MITNPYHNTTASEEEYEPTKSEAAKKMLYIGVSALAIAAVVIATIIIKNF